MYISSNIYLENGPKNFGNLLFLAAKVRFTVNFDKNNLKGENGK